MQLPDDSRETKVGVLVFLGRGLKTLQRSSGAIQLESIKKKSRIVML